MQKNDQLELAYNFVQYTDKNIFLTGKAGTGKTTFLHNLKSSTLKRMAIVAPTGVAAINAGGVTIHSFFQLPFGPFLSQELVKTQPGFNAQRNQKFNKEKINLIRSLDLLVIDEISMVRADLLDGIDEVLRRYKNHLKPFGGVQLLMIGDLHQLSPVVKDNDWKILRNYYPNLYFFSSRALQQALPVCIELKHIYRQSDTIFIDLLNRVRENKIDADVLNKLNQRHIAGFNPSDEEGYITLTTHNNTAQEINDIKLKEIKSLAHTFKAVINNEFPEYSYPTVVQLEIKVGAQVMFVKNDPSRDKLFYNGKIGKVTRIDTDKIYVKCPADNWEIEVLPAEWENIKYELNSETKEVEEKVIGSFTQYPIKLAWAITIHKSQGLTFEKAIIDASASFAHGQVYVALSRCKSFEGMVLRSPIAFNSVRTDGTISAYTKHADENPPGEDHLTESKIAFQQSLLYDLFDFNTIKSRFFYCNKLVEEHDHILASSVKDDLNEIKAAAEKDVYTIAPTFIKELNRLLALNQLPEQNEDLQERVKKACLYFKAKIEERMLQPLNKLGIETDNKIVRKSITEALENFRKEMSIKLAALITSSTGFNTTTYLKTKANAEIDYVAALTKPEVPAKTAAPKNVTHYELYARLKKWRDELAAENNVPVYLVIPSKVLVDLADVLPSSLPELETIKGIGKQKVKQFGDDILNIISTYCQKNNIRQTAVQIPIKEEKIKIDTKQLSFDLFKAGKTIDEIALTRGFSAGTIEGHLAHYIGIGQLDITALLSKEKIYLISNYISNNRLATVTDIKIALGDEVSYGNIRAVIKHLEFAAMEV